MASNGICHIEISTANVHKGADFYNKLFGWKLNFDMGDEYILFQTEVGLGGGFTKSEKTGSGGLVIYVEVDNIDAYLIKAVDLGGKPVVSKTEIPNVGWFGHFADLDGNTIGLFTAQE
ncbi:MAG: VOC family protein [FCB group bacterium]|nr:VOC family protein [FCB group bacterium]